MIQHDEYGRAYTTDYNEARKFKIKDRTPTHFIKSDFLKQKYATEGKWIDIYTSHGGRYYLPPSEGVNEDHHVKNPFSFKLPIELYKHQSDALEHIYKYYQVGYKSSMVVSGTGSGKSLLMLAIIQKLGLRTVIVVPTTTIAKGLYTAFSPVLNFISCHIQSGVKSFHMSTVTIMTHQTFNKAYDIINNNEVPLLLIDEAHHLPLKRLDQFNLWKGKFICGVTATPDRKEFGKEGFEKIFGNIYDTGKQSLPVKVYHYDYDHVRQPGEVMKLSEGLSPDSPEIYRRMMIANEDRTRKLVSIIKIMMNQGNTRFIVFSDRVDHVKKIVTVLKEHFKNVYEFIGDSDKEKVINEFTDGIIVGNIQCCGEGFNIPSLEVGILFVSTSRTVSVDQAVGRVRRTFGNKTHGILIDFIDTIRIGSSRPKKLGWYARKKIYEEKKWEMKNLLDILQ